MKKVKGVRKKIRFFTCKCGASVEGERVCMVCAKRNNHRHKYDISVRNQFGESHLECYCEKVKNEKA